MTSFSVFYIIWSTAAVSDISHAPEGLLTDALIHPYHQLNIHTGRTGVGGKGEICSMYCRLNDEDCASNVEMLDNHQLPLWQIRINQYCWFVTLDSGWHSDRSVSVHIGCPCGWLGPVCDRLCNLCSSDWDTSIQFTGSQITQSENQCLQQS